jgi:DNA helicase II / ATP-dependent DNA helicase PcrA
LNLNSEQNIAVHHKEGPLLIFAGAGSGKTRVITNRIIHLIQYHKIEAKKIVALSFTNKSAKEMRDRIRKMIDRKYLKGIELSTFHSLGLKICKTHIEKLDYKIPFLISGPSDLELVLSDILKTNKIDPKTYNLKYVLGRISLMKNNDNKPLDFQDEIQMLVNLIFDSYCETLKNLNSLDFDDLILKPIEILTKFPEIREEYHNKYKFFMIDEFQDTNLIQYRFIRLLLGNTNLCVVGDDDQSIYSFRGSNREIILNFEKDFPETKVIKLLRNYRSTVNIIEAANSLIKHNTNRNEKQLWSENYSDEKPIYVERLDEKEEAIFVVDKIQELLVKNKLKGEQIAVLFRTNYQSRPFEEELKLRGIPFKLLGAYNFFDRKEVKDLLAYIRIIANHKDDLSMLRILNYPRRGLGQNSQLKIQEKSREFDTSIFEILLRICEQSEYIPSIKKNTIVKIVELVETIQKYHKDFYSSSKMSEVLKNLIKDLKFEAEISLEEDDERVIKARMYNLSELVNMLSYFENEWEDENKPTLFDFLVRIALLTNDDDNNENKNENRIQMMTMHLSKGLEFDAVFLVGLEEGILPSSKSTEPHEIDEERRLMYVGITRAKKYLYLSCVRNRKKFGESIPSSPSRFIDELDTNYIIRTDKGLDEKGNEFSFLDLLESLRTK